MNHLVCSKIINLLKSLLYFRKCLFNEKFIHKFTWTHVMTPLKVSNKSTSGCIATLFRQIFKGN